MHLNGNERPGTRPPAPPCGARCRGVSLIVCRIYCLTRAGARPPIASRGRLLCRLRQIGMYVCHVVLQMTLSEVGRGFGRDRATVRHACRLVELQRDERAFDAFVSAVEHVVELRYVLPSEERHEAL